MTTTPSTYYGRTHAPFSCAGLLGLKVSNKDTIADFLFGDTIIHSGHIMGEIEDIEPLFPISSSISGLRHVHVFTLKDKTGRVPVLYTYSVMTDVPNFPKCLFCSWLKAKQTMPATATKVFRILGQPGLVLALDGKTNITVLKSDKFEAIAAEQEKARLSHHALSARSLGYLLAKDIPAFSSLTHKAAATTSTTYAKKPVASSSAPSATSGPTKSKFASGVPLYAAEVGSDRELAHQIIHAYKKHFKPDLNCFTLQDIKRYIEKDFPGEVTTEQIDFEINKSDHALINVGSLYEFERDAYSPAFAPDE